MFYVNKLPNKIFYLGIYYKLKSCILFKLNVLVNINTFVIILKNIVKDYYRSFVNFFKCYNNM